MSVIFLGQFNSRYQRPAGNESLAKKTWSCSSHRYHFRLWDVDLKSNLLPLGFPHCDRQCWQATRVKTLPFTPQSVAKDGAVCEVGIEFFFGGSICSDKLEKELKLSQILGECGLYVEYATLWHLASSCIQTVHYSNLPNMFPCCVSCCKIQLFHVPISIEKSNRNKLRAQHSAINDTVGRVVFQIA